MVPIPMFAIQNKNFNFRMEVNEIILEKYNNSKNMEKKSLSCFAGYCNVLFTDEEYKSEEKV